MSVSLKSTEVLHLSFVFVATLAVVATSFLVGCHRKAPARAGALQASVQFEPNPPTAHGPVKLTVSLFDAVGQPLQTDQLEVEANMNHAGMTPVSAHLNKSAPGQFVGEIQFTMAGDWFLLLSGQLSSNTHFVKKIEVPGVKAQE